MKEGKTLIQKLNDIRREVSRITKDGENQHFKFNYVSSSAVLNKLRPLMDAHGVLLVPSVLTCETTEIGSEKKQILTHIRLKYTWINEDIITDRLECEWYGQGADASERGVGKAYTYAEKYFLLKFFNIPTDDDDPDADGNKKRDRQHEEPRPLFASTEPMTLAATQQRQSSGTQSSDKKKFEGTATEQQRKMIKAIGAKLWQGSNGPDWGLINTEIKECCHSFGCEVNAMSKEVASKIIEEFQMRLHERENGPINKEAVPDDDNLPF